MRFFMSGGVTEDRRRSRGQGRFACDNCDRRYHQMKNLRSGAAVPVGLGVQAHVRHLRQDVQAQAPPEEAPRLRVRDRPEVQVRVLPAPYQVQEQPDEAHPGQAPAPARPERRPVRSPAGPGRARRHPGNDVRLLPRLHAELVKKDAFGRLVFVPNANACRCTEPDPR
ncbi:uncharacterized protein LOC117224672 isoform X1 [Megalopta genalis]|uniref:uncharacterized protein LOC117224672 isoform X1 n=1 Tax=Megalopta genalis TaxID=115081 RepID=UPI003FCF3E30